MGRANRNFVGVGFVLALVLLCANAVVTSRNVWTLHVAQTQVGRTREVIVQTAQVLSLLTDAETGQRGYLLLGQDEYLAPYRTAATEIEPALDRLAMLTENDPHQQARVGDLRRLARAKMTELRETVTLRRGKGRDAALALMATGRGRALMEQARTVAGTIDAEEAQRLKQRAEAAHVALDRTISAFVVATSLALGLLLAVWYIRRRDERESARTADEARQEHEWLATTVASIGEAVIATDGQGRVRLLNPVAAALTRWTPEEAAGRASSEVFRIIDELTRTPLPDPVTCVIRDGVGSSMLNHSIVVARDGTETPVEDSAAPIKDAGGRVIGVVVVFRDVSRERSAERLVRESRDRLRMAVDSAGLGTWELNPLTGEVSLDERCKAIFGLAADATVDYERYLSTLHADDRPRVDALVKAALDPSGTGELIAEYRVGGSTNGAARWVSSRGHAYFEEHGWAIRIIGTALDVTDSRRAAEALRAAKDEAEDANRAKDQFLAVLSHELRTPLNPILLAVTSMLEGPTPPEEVRPNLEMIRLYVNLQARLIDDLLDVTRIVQGKLPLHWEVADCHALIEEAVRICQGEVVGKELAIRLALRAEDHYVNADPARLEQVFWNLIKNAVKFSPGGGVITIRTRNEADQDARGRRLIIEVSDTGIGIEPDVLPTIFEPFRQGESSITRRFGGMGLGLAISKGIVEGHGGLLAARSGGRGQGATFQLALRALPPPKYQARPPAPQTESALAPPHRSPCKVLLVEDEPATLRLMTRLLRGLGHDVITASSLSEAVTALQGADVELVISDIGLPDGSGLDLMRQVTAHRGAIPGIALTGYGMEADIQRSREAGFTAHLTKPIDFSKLAAVIREVTKPSSESETPIGSA